MISVIILLFTKIQYNLREIFNTNPWIQVQCSKLTYIILIIGSQIYISDFSYLKYGIIPIHIFYL